MPLKQRNYFYKWFLQWQKPNIQDINIMISYPNELRPNIIGDNIVILELFEKVNQGIDAKIYLKKVLNKADEYGIDIYLYAQPRHKYIQDEKHKAKINKQYLIEYYQSFGFNIVKDNLMFRKANK
jgi:transposase-like protein